MSVIRCRPSSRADAVLLPMHALEGVSEDRLRSLKEAASPDKPRKSRRWLHCRACGHKITREDDRIPVLGLHEHTRTNPHGITFRFGSFRNAQGCATSGEPIAAFTWFAGYYWRLALCGGCRIHLGWRFEGAGANFFGLVLERLIATH
jgi:hypothetical protein